MIVDKYPHIKELYHLGFSETAEGRLFTKKYDYEINREYDRFIDEYRLRKELGGSKIIHKMIEDGNIE
jgi:hypothetical protein